MLRNRGNLRTLLRQRGGDGTSATAKLPSRTHGVEAQACQLPTPPPRGRPRGRGCRAEAAGRGAGRRRTAGAGAREGPEDRTQQAGVSRGHYVWETPGEVATGPQARRGEASPDLRGRELLDIVAEGPLALVAEVPLNQGEVL